MEGVVKDYASMGPLVVLDGANVAYAYADALGGGESADNNNYNHHYNTKKRLQPNLVGIQVACDYFAASSLGIRVLVVLPASYYRIKPRNAGGGLVETDQWDILERLKQEGKLAMAPPTDDEYVSMIISGLVLSVEVIDVSE